MRMTLVALLLLSLGLTGCIVEPGGGYREHGYWDGGHGDTRVERGN
jgi:hypothetical protein